MGIQMGSMEGFKLNDELYAMQFFLQFFLAYNFGCFVGENMCPILDNAWRCHFQYKFDFAKKVLVKVKDAKWYGLLPFLTTKINVQI